MGMRSALRRLLNLHQGGMTVTEYHKWWTANKELAEEFGYKVGDSDWETDRECKASGLRMLDIDYDRKSADARDVAGEKSLAATFFLMEDRHQYDR